jgi:hypothetical protein
MPPRGIHNYEIMVGLLELLHTLGSNHCWICLCVGPVEGDLHLRGILLELIKCTCAQVPDNSQYVAALALLYSCVVSSAPGINLDMECVEERALIVLHAGGDFLPALKVSAQTRAGLKPFFL